MTRIAILDDYQDAARRLADWGGPLQIRKLRRGCYELVSGRALTLESAGESAP